MSAKARYAKGFLGLAQCLFNSAMLGIVPVLTLGRMPTLGRHSVSTTYALFSMKGLLDGMPIACCRALVNYERNIRACWVQKSGSI